MLHLGITQSNMNQECQAVIRDARYNSKISETDRQHLKRLKDHVDEAASDLIEFAEQLRNDIS